MNELIKNLSDKLGLSESQAFEAAKIVIIYLKDKLPDPAAAQLNNLLISTDGKENPGNAIKDLGSKFTIK